ncbi:Dihydrolipoamide acyltransferase [Giardia duodenalis]|uniref:Dihydrolipoamide acyltransferase n=1 Tax=Giardia intestinalis TaxID=5741 RepID=V6T7K5_GIAIN|nr:Dihydrolipoamide acyltransferase [Giardia intestinalis]
MPGLYHDELRRVWASLDANKGTRDPVELPMDGQALQGKGTYFNRLLTHTPASGQSGNVLSADVRRADRGGKGPEGEGRLDHGADKRHLPGLPHGRPSTTRHDMIVACLYLRVSGKLNRSWKSRPTATSATRTRSPASGSSTSARR